MDVSSHGPAFLACNYAERFGVYRPRSANGLFEDAREDDFLLSRSTNLKCWGCNWTQFRCDRENAIEFALIGWFRDICRNLYIYPDNSLEDPIAFLNICVLPCLAN